MSNEIIRLFLVIVLSVGVIMIWDYIRPDLKIKNKVSNIQKTTKIEIVKVTKEDKNSNKKIPTGVIATPIYNVFKKINNQIKDVGWAIVLMTLLLKILTLPFLVLSNKYSLKMKSIQKEIEVIKKDKSSSSKQIAKKTMELMKKHKVNPLKGFLPMLIQMPLFFAFFAVLRTAPELEGASFIGFITNLSLPDPLYILPILSVIAISLQMFLSQNEGNKKLLFAMTIVSLIFMVNLPSSVQVYILTSSVLAIIFQAIPKLKINTFCRTTS